MSEVVIGVDAHKRSHTLVAVDGVGRKLAERIIGTTSEDHLTAVAWAGQWPVVRFALEDCRHVTRRLERDLLAAGYAVVRVPTHLMAAARRGGRAPGKSDPIDALAVAQAALREPDLPIARLDGPAREVKLLADHRHHLVVERTELVNRLRWHLHELDPALQIPSRGLRRYRVIDDLATRLRAYEGLVARLTRELITRCRELHQRLQSARANGALAAFVLGVGVDPLTLSTNVLTVVVIDDDVFTDIFGSMIRLNEEGEIVAVGGGTPMEGIPFTQAAVRRMRCSTRPSRPARPSCARSPTPGRPSTSPRDWPLAWTTSSPSWNV